jgi:hypothetical protein
VELPPLLTAGSRLIPPTMMDWEKGPPPSQWRLPIDEELMLLVSRKRRPVIRSESAIVAEFPSLDWDGPYRAVRFFLFDFWLRRRDWDTSLAQKRKILKQAEAHVDLLSDVRKSIRTYLDEIENGHVYLFFSTKKGQRLGEWLSTTRSLPAAVTKIERLGKIY